MLKISNVPPQVAKSTWWVFLVVPNYYYHRVRKPLHEQHLGTEHRANGRKIVYFLVAPKSSCTWMQRLVRLLTYTSCMGQWLRNLQLFHWFQGTKGQDEQGCEGKFPWTEVCFRPKNSCSFLRQHITKNGILSQVPIHWFHPFLPFHSLRRELVLNCTFSSK